MARRQKKADASLTLFSFQDIMCCLVGVLVLIALLLAVDGLQTETQISKARVEPAAAAAAAAVASEQSEELAKQVETLRRELEVRQAGTAVSAQEVEVLEARARQLAVEQDRMRARLAALDAQVAAIKADADARAAELERLRDRQLQAELLTRRDRVRLRPGAVASRAPFFIEVFAAGLRVGDLDGNRAPILAASLPGAGSEAQLSDAIGARSASSHYAVLVVHADGIVRFEALRDTLFRRGYEVGWQLWDAANGPFLEQAPTSSSAASTVGAP